ncbi:unnamed protein product [Rhodiola kirilowii]
MCARIIYCTNIDKKIPQTDVRILFESVCGHRTGPMPETPWRP